jgi:hypothetical protein
MEHTFVVGILKYKPLLGKVTLHQIKIVKNGTPDNWENAIAVKLAVKEWLDFDNRSTKDKEDFKEIFELAKEQFIEDNDINEFIKAFEYLYDARISLPLLVNSK